MLRDFIIHNKNKITNIVNSILNASLEVVDPYHCTKRCFRNNGSKLILNDIEIIVGDYEHIYVIGTGKAVLPMAQAVHDCIGNKITAGNLIAKHENQVIQSKLPDEININIGTHPIPSLKSVTSTRKLVEFLEIVNENDLVICLISGGGSALMTLPFEGITIEDMQEVTRLLLFSGAAIDEVNTVRKHLDQVKGGGLARKIWPANLVTLVLSDVIGDPLDAIASGPTVYDSTTFADAKAILEKYKLTNKIPKIIAVHIDKGVKGEISETVKANDECVQKTHTFIIGSLSIAVQAAKHKAVELGFNTDILTTQIKGEARDAGENLANQLLEIVKGNDPLKKPVCLIAGGETTVTVQGQGKGGRNQETALSAARVLQGQPNCMFISLATDGEDGPTDAAGAVVDGKTINIGRKLGLSADDYLKRNDAYTYLDKTGSLIKIGPTGTNVNDLIIMLAFEDE